LSAIITETSAYGQTVAVMNATHAAWRSSGHWRPGAGIAVSKTLHHPAK